MRVIDGVDFNSSKGVNVATPTNPNDVVNKTYADAVQTAAQAYTDSHAGPLWLHPFLLMGA